MSSYLVTGATGHQGNAVVNHLLAAGAKVHAVVRNQSSAKAVGLQKLGVRLFEGTHEEPDAVFQAAARGCTGVFLNPTVFEPGTAKLQAEAVIRACIAGGSSELTTIVLSSTSRTDEVFADPGLATAVHPFLAQYYTAKAEVEAAVRNSGIPHYTILRPPVLAYDFLLPASAAPNVFPYLPRTGTLVTSLDEGNTMPYLSEDDLGKVAAAALLQPEKFSGAEIELAADNLTASEVCAMLTRVSGIKVKTHKRTAAEMEESKMTEFFQVFERLANNKPKSVESSALSDKYNIKLTRLEEYLELHKALLIESLPPRSVAALSAP